LAKPESPFTLSKIFLEAEWRKLAMANYEIDPAILEPYLPAHTQLDLWEGKCFVSIIGFLFLNTSVMGWKVPFHINFEEVNLRFYVIHNHQGETRRGVVFIKEIVPKLALTIIANAVYKEHYQTMPMKHQVKSWQNQWQVQYSWKTKNNWNHFSIETNNEELEIQANSVEDFITEHYWGYTQLKNNKTLEYAVLHPKWKIYHTIHYQIQVNFEQVYGSDFSFLQQVKPHSVFLAEGSTVAVKNDRRIIK
jgi:uncharacterized protein